MFARLNRINIAPAVLLMASISACQAGPRQIEGYYRYGHEVNTVCLGEPELCYWLVDTSPEIRADLKQRVADLEPYAPLCLVLIAETSPEKGPGFGADYDGSIRVQQVVGPCGDTIASSPVLLEDLQHRRWVLVGIDGTSLAKYAAGLGFAGDSAPRKIPELDFGEQGFVAGNTGCNQIRGRASIEDGQLVLSQLASTRMACPGFSDSLEQMLLRSYANGLEIARDGETLLLEGENTRLEFRLRDWE